MISVIYAILAITIKDLEMHLVNSNLPLEKNAIQSELSSQKGETDM